MTNSPCFHCQDRRIGCHGHCDKEKQYLDGLHNKRLLIFQGKHQEFEANEYEALRNEKAKLRK